MRNLFLGGVLGFGLAVVLLVVLTYQSPPPLMRTVILYSQLIADVDDGKVDSVTFRGSKVMGRFKNQRP
jgi:hypothetical protein